MDDMTTSDVVIARQLPTNLVTRRVSAPRGSRADLQDRYWPPVVTFQELDPELRGFLGAPRERQESLLHDLRGDEEAHGRYLHTLLSEIYAYCFGYRDGACTSAPDDDLETALLTAKIRLERELLDHWMTPDPVAEIDDQLEAADHLDVVATTNPGVTHPLFDHLRDEASARQLQRFLQCEVIRNEVVDDEVALLVVGLQGMHKNVAAANLWDECGRGKLEHFHTFWLRSLLEATDGWDSLARYRHSHPWFAKITSNTNAVLLTRPAYKYMAYGCFLVFESWVEPHFRRILDGMDRLGIADDDVRIYFDAHVKIDPRHSRELSDGMRMQRPRMTPAEVRQVLYGAHLASSAGVRQFDRMLGYLRALDSPETADTPETTA
jgi:hypothetical protein